MLFRQAMGWTDQAVWERQPADVVAQFLAYWEAEVAELGLGKGHTGV